MINTNIYTGDNNGGPIDYSAPVLTVAGTVATLPALPAGSRTWVGIRALDTVSGLEEINVDAKILIIVDSTGADASAVPRGPVALSAVSAGSGAVRLTWDDHPRAGSINPQEWGVYATPGGVIDWTAPSQWVPWLAGKVRYTVTLTGYSPGAAVALAVRGLNGAATDGNLTVLTWTPLPDPGPAAHPGATAVDQGD